MELLTYCVIDEDGKNRACKLNGEGFQRWKEDYCNDFKDDSWKLVRKHYFDPDKAYYIKYSDHQFFYDLVDFLNESEKKLRGYLDGEYFYQFVIGKGIGVCNKEEGKFRHLFYLRSDQLGFFAPSEHKNHPYDLYIQKCHSKDEAIYNVADWVGHTRTIGGSFLWPVSFWKNYNPRRGGTITSKKSYYIQDRVDLTLQEIKHWYDGYENNENKSDILYQCNCPELNLWLGHFKEFETYCDFFCFDDIFVNFKNGDKKINSIIPDKLELPKGNNRLIEIDKNMSEADLKVMLDGLSNMIKNRSNKMIKRINDKDNE